MAASPVFVLPAHTGRPLVDASGRPIIPANHTVYAPLLATPTLPYANGAWLAASCRAWRTEGDFSYQAIQPDDWESHLPGGRNSCHPVPGDPFAQAIGDAPSPIPTDVSTTGTPLHQETASLSNFIASSPNVGENLWTFYGSYAFERQNGQLILFPNIHNPTLKRGYLHIPARLLLSAQFAVSTGQGSQEPPPLADTLEWYAPNPFAFAIFRAWKRTANAFVTFDRAYPAGDYPTAWLDNPIFSATKQTSAARPDRVAYEFDATRDFEIVVRLDCTGTGITGLDNAGLAASLSSRVPAAYSFCSEWMWAVWLALKQAGNTLRYDASFSCSYSIEADCDAAYPSAQA